MIRRRSDALLTLLAYLALSEACWNRQCNSDILSFPSAPYNNTANKVLSLLNNYDNLVRPNYDEGTYTTVTCDIYINNIDSISVDTMDYSVNLYMRQTWVDDRLAFDDIYPNISQLTLDTKLFNLIWVPDLFFANEKQGYSHCVTVPNRLIRIYANGTVLYSARYTLRLTCQMSLEVFPFDAQQCHMYLESYGYTEDEMRFVWRNDTDPIHTNPNLQFPQFNLENYEVDDCKKSYITGDFTCLKATFFLQRKYGYYLIQNYMPSGLIVILSWVSFWINIDAVPARISLGVLTVLTMTTQCVGLWMSLPRVSYVKAIDIWMSICVLFVFTAMLEFAFVNTLARYEIRKMTMTKHKPRTTDDKSLAHMVKIKPMIDEYTYGVLKTIHPDKRLMARTLDSVSRIAFPFAFIIFNAVYWSLFLFSKTSDK